MIFRTMKIKLPADNELAPSIAEAFDRVTSTHPTGAVPPIYRTMSYNAEFFHGIKLAVEAVHFCDGALTRAQHEMIASWVSAINRCRY